MVLFFFAHHFQEEVDVRSLVHEEPDRMPVDGDLEDEVGRRAGLHGLADDSVVVGVDQRLVEVEDQDLTLDQACKGTGKSC